jgi:hypothetical protein
MFYEGLNCPMWCLRRSLWMHMDDDDGLHEWYTWGVRCPGGARALFNAMKV